MPIAFWLVLGAIGFLAAVLYVNEKKCRRKEADLGLGKGQNDIVALDTPEVSSPAGLSVLVSVGPKKKPLPVSHPGISIVERSGSERLYKCGHHGPRSFTFDVYGERVSSAKGNTGCPDCVLAMYQKHVIRCALCGLSIAPGEAVALYSSESADIHLEHATRVDGAVIGCLRWDCCPSGGFFSGHWSEEGYKPLFGGKTAAESCMSGES